MKIASLVILFAVLLACKNSEPKCRFGEPTPILSDKLPHVKLHEFEKKGGESVESVIFDNQVALEIAQSGCESIRQEFRFAAPGDRRQVADSLWAKEAVRQLVFLSSLGPKQAPLRAWADALEKARPDMKLGEETSLGGGVVAQVNKVAGADQSVLTLVFSQKME